MLDDANIPSLLALPYIDPKALGYVNGPTVPPAFS